MFDDDPGSLAVLDDSKQLSFLAEETELLSEAKQCEHRIRDALSTVMKVVVLPESRRIGECLTRVRELNPPGRKGPGGSPSPFFAKVERLAGWGKRSVQGYISIYENYDALMYYVIDPPAGGMQITSLRSALKVLTWIKEQERRKALPQTPAIEVKAVSIPMPKTSPLRKIRADHGRLLNAVLDYLPEHSPYRTAIGEHQLFISALLNLAANDEEAEDLRGWDELPEPDLEPGASPEPVLVEQVEPEDSPARVALTGLYPATAEGLAALEREVLKAGGGPQLARQLGVTTAAISNRRYRIKKELKTTHRAEL